MYDGNGLNFHLTHLNSVSCHCSNLGFAYLESPILVQMTLISCPGQPRPGTDDLFCN